MAVEPEMGQYLEAFLAEAEDEIAHMQTHLDRLTREGAKLVIVEEAARATANLKSAAATMGFSAVRDLAHATMDMLNAWRRGSVKDPNISLELLRRALTKLSDAIKLLREGKGPQASEADLMIQLRALVTEDAENPWPEAEQPLALDPSERRFVIKMVLETPCPHPAGRYLVCQGYLLNLGKVVAADSPPDEKQAESEISLRFLLATTKDMAELRRAIQAVPHVHKIEITPANPELEALPPEAKGRKKVVFQNWTVHIEAHYLDDLGEIPSELAQIRSGYRTLENELITVNPGLAFRLSRLGDRLEYPIRQLTEFLSKLQQIPAEVLANRLIGAMYDKASDLGKEILIKVTGGSVTIHSEQAEDLLLLLQQLLNILIEDSAQTAAERQAAGKAKQNRVEIKFSTNENKISINLSDDGKGLELERELKLGKLAVLRRELETRGATLEGQAWPGQGSLLTVELSPPGDYLSVLSIAVGNEFYAVPLETVLEARRASDDVLVRIDGQVYLPQGRDMIPLYDLAGFLGKPVDDKGGFWLFTKTKEQRFILRVPAVMGPRQVSLRTGAPMQLPALSACGDSSGQIYMLLDLEILVKTMKKAARPLGKAAQGAKK